MTNSPKVILITGCSSGFGLLTAARLASKGHHIYATMRDLSKQGPLNSEVNDRGGKVTILPMDVTVSSTIDPVLREIGACHGYLDAVINNAGIAITGFFEDLSDEEIRQVMETNFFGVLNVTRAVIPMMRARRSGKIINISSIAGQYAAPAFSAYNASKWALEAFSESLYFEMKLFGIDVVLIEPGAYKTKIFRENRHYAQNSGREDSPYYPYTECLKDKVDEALKDNYRDPEDVAVTVEKILNTKSPKFRYLLEIENRILLALRKYLPFKLYSYLFMKSAFKGIKQ